MQYTIVNKSGKKFQINGYEMYKTFVPFKVGSKHVSILNVYDSKYVLMPKTKVSDVEVDGETYSNANELITALVPVVYAFQGDGNVDEQQIEINRQNIEDLQGDIADIERAFDSYYTKDQVDNIIDNLNIAGVGYASGEVDGNELKFKDDRGQTLLSVDVKQLKDQGTTISFDKETGKLLLKNTFGETLSSTKVKAKETKFDELIYEEDAEEGLSGFQPTEEFTLAKTNDEEYYFVQRSDSRVNLDNSRLYLNDLNLYLDLNNPDIEKEDFVAWKISEPEDDLIVSNKYGFNFWPNQSINTVYHEDSDTVETTGKGTKEDPLKSELKKTDKYARKDKEETVSEKWTFQKSPQVPKATGDNDAVRKKELDKVEDNVNKVYKPKGSVEDLNALFSISDPEIGDVYNVKDDGTATDVDYGYVGERNGDTGTNNEWNNLGGKIDLSGYQRNQDRISEIDEDRKSTDKYTSEKSVVEWVKNKISGFLKKVFHQDSDTVKFSGKGTESDPLKGEVLDSPKLGGENPDYYAKNSQTLKKQENLSDLPDKAKARDNLQLGSAALQKDGDYLHKTTEENRVAMKNDTALDAMIGKEFDNKSSPYGNSLDLINAGYTAENGYLQGSEIIMTNTNDYTRYEKIADDDLEWMVYTNADGWQILN